jgi:hypothetical protein
VVNGSIMTANATLLVCDDVRFETGGKLLVIGAYSGDIAIPADPSQVSQLVFVISVDIPIDETPSSITTEIQLPGAEPSISTNNLIRPEAGEGRSTFMYRQIMGVKDPILKPGRIYAKVSFGEREIEMATPWIVMASAPPTVSLPPSEQSPNVPPE